MAIAVGLDVGKTNIKTVAVNQAGAILWRSKRATDVEQTAQDAAELLARAETELGQVAFGVGIAAPGLASADRRCIARLPGDQPRIEGLDWTEHLQRSRPVSVLNDAHAAALGEHWIGAARETNDALMLTLGTGVGGGIIMDGKLRTGHHGRAGHLGHISVDPSGLPSLVGIPGGLEDAIGNRTLLQRSEGRFHATGDLVEHVKAGDQHAVEVWDASIRALALALCGLINCFSPEVVVIGGGISRSGDALFIPLADYMRRWEWRPMGEPTPVRAARLGSFSGAVGAALAGGWTGGSPS